MDVLKDISLFVEVASSGNFRPAAERLQMAISKLSRRVALLERRLGMKLLVRTTRSVNLATAGAVYLQRCKSIVARNMQAWKHQLLGPFPEVFKPSGVALRCRMTQPRRAHPRNAADRHCVPFHGRGRSAPQFTIVWAGTTISFT